MPKKRYAIVGAGGRSRMFARAIAGRYRDICELVAICDVNIGRAKLLAGELKEKCGEIPAYLDSDFDRMLDERKVETVIVTTKDCFHDKYITRALGRDRDCVTEKPMTTDEHKCQRIIDAVKDSGRKLRVTFNYRYSPARTQLKDLLISGVIGKVLSVDFHWLLDTRHGASYFRRWHRNRKNSGGLMVHKATHHFDLVNWWLSTRPVEVKAAGSRRFYLPSTAEKYGLKKRGERCLDCPEKGNCKFFLDLRAKPMLKGMYLDQEQHDGYIRDGCVFSEKIDIEDTMNLNVRYKSGAFMSYSLNAFSPIEGYEIRFNGSKGRLEHTTMETSYESGVQEVPGETVKHATKALVRPHFKEPYPVEVWHGRGGHGGGDSPLLDSVFLPEPPEDKYMRSADYLQGAWSILTGVAANKSMASGEPVRVEELVTGLGEPEFPPMPEW